jgi:hypothetical protein
MASKLNVVYRNLGNYAHMAIVGIAPAAFLIVGITHGAVGTILSAFACFILFWFIVLRYVGNAVFLVHVEAACTAIDELSRRYKLSRWRGEDFIDEDTLAVVRWQGGRIIAIATQPIDNTTPPLGTLRAYIDIFDTAVVILADPPRHLSNPHLFFLYHEIGHFTVENVILTCQQSKKLAQFSVTFLPCLLLVQNWWIIGFLLLIYSLFWWLTSWNRNVEQAADIFATARLVQLLGYKDTVATLEIVRTNFRRVAESPRLESVDKTREFWHRASMLDQLAHKVSEKQMLDLYKFSAPVFSVFELIRILGSVALVVVLGVWGKPLSVWMTILVIIAALALPHRVYLMWLYSAGHTETRELANSERCVR